MKQQELKNILKDLISDYDYLKNDIQEKGLSNTKAGDNLIDCLLEKTIRKINK